MVRVCIRPDYQYLESINKSKMINVVQMGTRGSHLAETDGDSEEQSNHLMTVSRDRISRKSREMSRVIWRLPRSDRLPSMLVIPPVRSNVCIWPRFTVSFSYR